MINSVCGIRSTGRICTDLATEFERDGHTVKIAYGREGVPEKYQGYAVRIGSDADVRISAVHTRLTDKHGFANKRATKKFLAWAEAYDPDLLWLHNLHGYYINVEMLFAWIKSRPRMQVRWTLHDCWAFTGHCTHFTYAGCDQWKSRCVKCSETREYPAAYKDNCQQNYQRKKAAFTGVANMTLITPSYWLADLAQKSFLGAYPVEVRHNTIDTSVFKPTESNFRQQYHLEGKKIILGVASGWNDKKGLGDFAKLAGILSEDECIVLVGVTEAQKKQLPPAILSITRTDSTRRLAEIYTASDVFVNLTYEDTYPTVNLEAQACGTPCLTYRTGGSVESVPPENVVDVGDLEGMYKLIMTRNKKAEGKARLGEAENR